MDTDKLSKDNAKKDEEASYIIGDIGFTIYENPREHFTIARINIHETNEKIDTDQIVGKGHFFDLQQGVAYQFFGKIVHHRKFGMQYEIKSYKTYVPATRDAVIAYLSSDMFYGIGKKSATSIVDTLGEDAIDVILDNPEVLSNVPRLQRKTAQKLVETLQHNQGFEKIAVQLTRYGIGLKMAQTLFDKYEETTLSLIETNPYQFVFDIEGFGFLTAEKIANINGLKKDNPNRIKASCIHVLQESILEGHVYLPKEECMEKMMAIVQLDMLTKDSIIQYINELETDKQIVLKNDNIYLPTLYYAEDNLSAHIQRIIEKKANFTASDAELMELIGSLEEEEIISYGAEQFEAIKRALHAKLMILTGGPGTGKTTVVKGIVHVYAAINNLSLKHSDYDADDSFPFILTAPTGRAAKRLEESTGIRAMTIHRLLGWDGHTYFEKNEYDQLEGKFIIIDEFSMVDTWLANHLFKAIPNNMQVLIVGDEDQLPSVGPGQVLSDLYNSEHIPYVTLTEVYRQQDGSKIIDLAHEIKKDTCNEQSLTKERDFSFIDCKVEQVSDVVTTVIKRAIDKGIDVRDIQVLAPMYRSQAGITELNKKIQKLINPPAKNKRERTVKEAVFRVGDRVLQLVNQPEDGVYNGDIGEITEIVLARETKEKEEQIIVRFDDKKVIYPRTNYINLTHAYCISIHKAQGSEFPIVILPVVQSFRRMLRKNLLYTAITRSKRSLILCGEREAFLDGIAKVDVDNRNTTLKQFIQQKMNGSSSSNTTEKCTNTEDSNEDVIVIEEIEEEDSLSPYDFM